MNQGLETCMGYVSWIGKYETENSVLVDLLLKAGAVFYVKTSVPQSLMVCETVNNVIGRTVNPRNKNWSCGGSSGGEGAMVGFRGGIIGVGTDIGELFFLVIVQIGSDKRRWVNSGTFSFQFPIWS
jgi:amidase